MHSQNHPWKQPDTQSQQLLVSVGCLVTVTPRYTPERQLQPNVQLCQNTARHTVTPSYSWGHLQQQLDTVITSHPPGTAKVGSSYNWMQS